MEQLADVLVETGLKIEDIIDYLLTAANLSPFSSLFVGFLPGPLMRLSDSWFFLPVAKIMERGKT